MRVVCQQRGAQKSFQTTLFSLPHCIEEIILDRAHHLVPSCIPEYTCEITLFKFKRFLPLGSIITYLHDLTFPEAPHKEESHSKSFRHGRHELVQ
jgi:hypothetical protein